MSVVSVLLLAALITLVIASVHYRTGISHERSSPITSLVVSDLSMHVAESLFGMHLTNLSRKDGIARIMFSPAAELSSAIDHSARFETYATLAEANYASQGHLTLTLTNTEPEMILLPWDAVFRIDSDTFTASMSDHSDVQELTIRAQVSAVNVTTNSSPADSGGVPISVEVRDSLGAVVLDENAFLDLNQNNAAFSVTFDDGSSFNIWVGSTGARLIEAEVTALDANITLLDIELSDPGEQLSLTSRASLALDTPDEMALSRLLVVIDE